MDTEIEIKFADINPEGFREKLREAGARLEHPEILMRRKAFDYPDWRLEKKGGWARVRDEGQQTTMSYKQLDDRTLHGTREISVTVGDFEKACVFLQSIGLEEKAYQETKREKWTLRNVEVTIDTWPWIPPFVELEGTSEEFLREASNLLGFEWEKGMHGSVETVYQMHYDFTESEIDHWKSIVFCPPPEWLLAKKKV